MTCILFKNASILDCNHKDLKKGFEVLIENNFIRAVKQSPIQCSDAQVFDVAGKTLMPGLIDAHCHVTSPEMNPANDHISTPEIIQEAAHLLENILQRGFTSIREAGGAGYGLWEGIKKGTIKGPRLFYSGRALSQTGGTGDFRPLYDSITEPCLCSHPKSGSTVAVIADGVTEVRKAAREALRSGAKQIKMMASGRILWESETGSPIYNYSHEEIKAIVEEAAAYGTYVMAHCYTNESIRHCLEAGVRSIEHAIFLDDETAAQMAKKNAFMVPTLITIKAVADLSGVTGPAKERLYRFLESAKKAIQVARKHGIKIGFGSDLWGSVAHAMQLQEFSLRSNVDTPLETITSATKTNAELLNCSENLGVIQENAYADLLVVDGDPLKDINCLVNYEKHLKLVMKDGIIYRNNLS